MRLAAKDKIEAFREVVRTDTTTSRTRSFVAQGLPKLPDAAGQYLLDKVPIVQWLPRYHPSWLIQDAIAGLTIGVMLIPQGLSYAKIATIPIENGLYSSWIPSLLAVFMGTSKDLSTGPTSILGLLTSEIIESLSNEYTPTAIASAVAFMVGVYGLIMGLVGLGFLLDYVSVPVLTGFISATALTIAFGQVGSLVGLDKTPDGIFNIIGDVLKRLPHWNGPTCGIGLGTIAILLALEKVGQTWGKRNFAVKYVATSRAVVVMVVFTLISYLVNRNRGKDLVWAIAKVNTHGIAQPKAHDTALLSKVAGRAFAPLAASTLEHLAVAKAFGRRNGYAIDQTQELNYLGVTNLVNSFFSVMPVGGAMSRTAVNSECRVRSPLSGIVTSAFILLTLFVFSPALYWLPKATLAAIIIMAVIHLFGPVSLFYRYWRISLADFIASMLSFWITIFVSAEIGIGVAVAWSIVYTMLRAAFVKPTVHTEAVAEGAPATMAGPPFPPPPPAGPGPDDVVVVRFEGGLFYPNAQRAKRTALEAVQLVYEDAATTRYGGDARERLWSVAAARRVERLRRARGVEPRAAPPAAVVVWDLAAVSFIDVTAVLALGELKEDIRRHCGPGVRFRLVGLAPAVRERLERARWPLHDLGAGWKTPDDDADTVYPDVHFALRDRSSSSVLEAVVSEKIE